MWERLPDQVVLLATGRQFDAALALRNFAAEVLQTLQQRPLTTVGLVEQLPSEGDEIKQNIASITKQLQHILVALQPTNNINPQPHRGPATVLRPNKMRQMVQ